MTWFFTLLKQMSPQLVDLLKQGLKKLLDDLAGKAAETDNPWDDWAISMIRTVLKVED